MGRRASLILRRFSYSASVGFLLLATACGQFNSVPAINESGHETGHEIPGPGGDDPGPKTPAKNDPPPAEKTFALDQETNVRYNKNNVLEFVAELPKDAQILLPDDFQYVTWGFRATNGTIMRSSTGFIGPIRIKSVPGGSIPAGKIQQWNNTPGGLYVSASVIHRVQGVEGDFAAMTAATAQAGYSDYYEPSGRPRKSFYAKLAERFGVKVNAGVSMSTLSQAEQQKWQRIYNELKRAADRTVATPKSIIMIPVETALQASIDYEKTSKILPNGAWTIATQATAVRHKFANAPCAETMSEFIRQAYVRAGYEVTEDFNKTNENILIWNKTAAVVGLSDALFKAGWIPWDARIFAPPTGAILMHMYGQTPGHTYIAAGDHGRLIVDNGAPQGRDLRATKKETLGNQYQTGLFFLPPGINPTRW